MSKISTTAKNTAGVIQEGIGKVIGNIDMIAKGEQKQVEAHQQKIAAHQKPTGNAHGIVDEPTHSTVN
ncbi:hypothetical protein K7432_014548 [Basidiobolus ranarum]|uniref:CsbD family protein n=1 Tax=Basidiobolus ranarum TaxID=34480 RepID=A0ABR2WHG0_9FUNG